MSSNWWATKLNAQPSAPTQRPVVPQAPQAPMPQQPMNYPPTQQQVPLTERCPGCGSNNYGGATPESRKRCYDCGYPIQQSGSGVGKGVNVPLEGPTQSAVQVQTGGWNPQTIIGKLE